MANSLRVTKYHNYNIEGNLISSELEWTSYFDVGVKVSIEDYILVENEYINFIISLCDLFSIEYLTISELEIFDEDESFENHDLVTMLELPLVVRDVLRESKWCKLISDDVEIHFGYDFYMYIILSESYDFIKSKINTSLNVEVFKSPYV